MPNLERMWVSMQRLYSEELESSGGSCTIEASEVSEVSALSAPRSDTWLGSIPSFSSCDERSPFESEAGKLKQAKRRYR